MNARWEPLEPDDRIYWGYKEVVNVESNKGTRSAATEGTVSSSTSLGISEPDAILQLQEGT